MKYWEIIADNLHDAGWSLGWVSALDLEGRTIWIVDAHRGDGKRFVARADEKLTAFMELESAIRERHESGITLEGVITLINRISDVSGSPVHSNSNVQMSGRLEGLQIATTILYLCPGITKLS